MSALIKVVKYCNLAEVGCWRLGTPFFFTCGTQVQEHLNDGAECSHKFFSRMDF